MIKRLAAGGAAAVIGLGVWGVAGEDHTVRTDSGAIVESGELGAFATQVGDCFDGLPLDDAPVSTVQGLPCSNAHHWQVVHKSDSYLDTYDSDALDSEIEMACNAAIDGIIKGLSESKLSEYQNADISTLKPTAESWAKGDRTYDCLVGSDYESYFSSLLN
jgi:hypothetical protein